MLVYLEGATPLSQVVVQVSYDPNVVSLRSATAVAGSTLDTLVSATGLDAAGMVSVSLTATGNATTSGGVADLVIRRLAAGSVEVHSLTPGVGARCVGCSW